MAETKRGPHFRVKARRGRRMPVRYRSVGEGETGSEQRSFTRNIGVGGAFIETPDPAPPGTHLAVTLALENGPTIEVAAEVRWIVDGEFDAVHGMGVKFSGLDAEQSHTLNNYFATLPEAADLEELG
jgi:uncharacterized protein (TIGR02266 family)